MLLGRVPLLTRQEALEVIGSTLLVRARPGLQKSFTNLRHTPALSGGNCLEALLQARVNPKCQPSVLLHVAQILPSPSNHKKSA